MKLRECPFCGSLAFIKTVPNPDEDHDYEFMAFCPNNSCPVRPEIVGKTPEEVFDAWNTRPTPADVERLKSIITELEDALRWFCGRVEKGEVISKRTYVLFKALLDRVGGSNECD